MDHPKSHPTIWGTIKEPALWVTPEKKLSILQYGEILKKESAAVNTIATTLWRIPQNVVTTHISESTEISHFFVIMEDKGSFFHYQRRIFLRICLIFLSSDVNEISK